MSNQNLLTLINRLDSLPVLSSQYRDLSQLIATDQTDLQQVINIIEQKPSLVANILRMANTTYYARPIRVDSIKGAIQVIGIREVADMMLALDIIKGFGIPKGIDTERFWDHAVAVATLSKDLAECNQLNGELAYTLGLLHDLGILVIARFVPIDFKSLMNQISIDNTIYKAAFNLFGCTHYDITIRMLKFWSFQTDLYYPLVKLVNPNQHIGEDSHRLSSILHAAHKTAENHKYAFSWDVFPHVPSEIGIESPETHDFTSGIGAALLACYHN